MRIYVTAKKKPRVEEILQQSFFRFQGNVYQVNCSRWMCVDA
jgi:hypothetical protein